MSMRCPRFAERRAAMLDSGLIRVGRALAIASCGTVALLSSPSAPAAVAVQAAASVAVIADAVKPVRVPASPVGRQLHWLLGVARRLPLGDQEISAHFDAAFRAEVSSVELNQVLESLGAPGASVRLVRLTDVEPGSLKAVVQIGSARYAVTLSVDPSGLVSGLLFGSAAAAPRTWSQIEGQLATVAPGVSFLAARLDANGTCAALHSVLASTPRPLGSMFKLFVLGALANAVREHRISWTQKVAVTAAIKTGGSGTLRNVPDGTTLTVEQAAVKMISVSDNTAADLLLELVGRAAVEAQARAWVAHPSLDTPFLTASELFALKYAHYPALADHYISLSRSRRAAYLAATVDAIPSTAEIGATGPRDINSIEWFASADDLCRAFSGLAALRHERGLGQLNTILSTNSGGIGLRARTWPTVWFKGGSEPGVLTLGYLARDSRGRTFVVIVLTENPDAAARQQSVAVQAQLLAAIASAFALLR
jgi:beta-lactamase class A